MGDLGQSPSRMHSFSCLRPPRGCNLVVGYRGKNPYNCNCAYCHTGQSIKKHTFSLQKTELAIIDYIYNHPYVARRNVRETLIRNGLSIPIPYSLCSGMDYP
jgi:hypothetical protein